jgi:flagellin
MSLSIRTNVASLNAQRNLFATQLSLDSSLSRLSSGFRITKAGDDAAGLGISTKLESQIRSYGQATRNANDGLSVVQASEAALNEQANILTRLRELAMQSGSDGVGNSERRYIDTEGQKLLAELQRISQVTEYNGTKLLDGSAATLDFQVGIAATGNDRISLNTLNATTAGATGTVTGPASAAPSPFVVLSFVGISAKAFNDNMLLSNQTIAQSQMVASVALFQARGIFVPADNEYANATRATFLTGYLAAGGTPGSEAITGAPNLAQAAGLALVTATKAGGIGSGTGSAQLAQAYQAFAASMVAHNGNAGLAWGDAVTAAGGGNIGNAAGTAAATLFAAAYEDTGLNYTGFATLGSAATTAGLAALGQQYVPGAVTPSSSGGLGVAGLSLTTKASSLSALASIDSALATISSNRATLGAAGNRLQSAISNIQSFSESLSAANSRIKDVDVAEETSRMSRSQILMQAGISVLAQANQMPQMALKLLG